MAMMAMQDSRIGIRVVLISMILDLFLYVVAVVSAAQTAGDGVDGKNIAGFNAILAYFHSLFKNVHQHFMLRVALCCGRKQNCVLEPRIHRFTHLKEAGEFLWLTGICTD